MYLVRKKPRTGSEMPTLCVIDVFWEGWLMSRERLQLSAADGSVLGSYSRIVSVGHSTS